MNSRPRPNVPGIDSKFIATLTRILKVGQWVRREAMAMTKSTPGVLLIGSNSYTHWHILATSVCVYKGKARKISQRDGLRKAVMENQKDACSVGFSCGYTIVKAMLVTLIKQWVTYTHTHMHSRTLTHKHPRWNTALIKAPCRGVLTETKLRHKGPLYTFTA